MSNDGIADDQVERLSPAKRRLYERLQRQAEKEGSSARSANTECASVIERRRIDTECPLSLAQEALWFIEKLSPGTAAFNVPAAAKINNGLDIAALERAIDDLIARHDVLRMHFAERDGSPYVVFDVTPFVIERLYVDASESAEEAVIAEVRRPFDLATDRLFRISLIGSSTNDFDNGRNVFLVIVAHHSICDGRSIELFLDELECAYGTHARGLVGDDVDENTVGLQFGDYANWERERLKSGDFEPELAYWRTVLDKGLPELSLPVRTGSQAVSSRMASKVRFELPSEIVTELRMLAGRHNATLFMVVFAVWKLTLFAWSQQRELVVGIPVVNRQRSELQDILGMFTNTVAISTVAIGEQSFTEFFTGIRERVLAGLEHQELPFSKLIEILRLERAGVNTPLVRATIWLASEDPSTVKLSGVEMTKMEVDTGIATFDFSVVMKERDGGLGGEITFRTALFAREVVEAMANDFKNLAREVVAAPSHSLLSLVESATKNVLLELSENQLLVWMGAHLDSGSTVYNEGLRALMSGTINVDAFKRAWQEVVAKTDILRSRIIMVSGKPRIKIESEVTAALEIIDLSRDEDPEQSFIELTHSQLESPVDLEQSFATCVLARLGAAEYGVFLGIHHIVVDARSFQLMYERLQVAYASASGPGHVKPAESPSARDKFREIVADERCYVDSEQGRTGRAFWEQQNSQVPDLPALYGHVPHGGVNVVGRERFVLSDADQTALRSMASKPEFGSFSDDLTLMTWLLTLLGAYVNRVSGAETFAVGVPFHNRTTQGNRRTVGLLMTVCPVRIDCSGQPSFRTLQKRVMHEIYRCMPHTRVVNANGPMRPNYTVMFDFHTEDFESFVGTKSKVELFSSNQQLEALKLDVIRDSRSDRLEIWVNLSHAILATAGRGTVVTHFRRLFEAMVVDQDQVITDVDVLTTEEAAALHKVGKRGPIQPEFCPVTTRLNESVNQNPERIALIDGSRQLTYGALWRRSGEISQQLSGLSLGCESVVAMRLDGSFERVVTMLGILRAGCAYLPVHPENPPARVRELLNVAGVSLLLVDSVDAPWTSTADCRTLTIEELLSSERKTGLASCGSLHPEQAAYVLFTSGSSGQPKGVVVSQRALASFTDNACDCFDLSIEDRVLQFADLSFDTSIEEIMPTLIAGGALLMRPEGLLDTPGHFWDLLDRQAITVVNLPSSVWHTLGSALASSDDEIPASLNSIVVGGEQTQTRAFKQWSQALHRAANTHRRPLRFFNTYGPTETTVAVAALCSTFDDAAPSGDAVPIGRPFGTVGMVARTGGIATTPRWVPGELYISGSSLARGYVGRPAETALRFVPEIDATWIGARCFRSGDRAFLNDREKWVYAGRRDRQIKHNGYRIELDEIEICLGRVPGVDSGAIFTSNHGEITAVFLADERGANPDAVRVALGRVLPPFMIPTTIRRLEELPLDCRGKIDYRRLRALGVPSCPRVLPSTSVERRVVEIWSSLLEIPMPDLSVTDNFFEVGGHSLLGMQLMARLENSFAIELPLQKLFDAPTILGLSEVIENLMSMDGDEFESLLCDLESLSPGEVDALFKEIN